MTVSYDNKLCLNLNPQYFQLDDNTQKFVDVTENFYSYKFASKYINNFYISCGGIKGGGLVFSFHLNILKYKVPELGEFTHLRVK